MGRLRRRKERSATEWNDRHARKTALEALRLPRSTSDRDGRVGLALGERQSRTSVRPPARELRIGGEKEGEWGD